MRQRQRARIVIALPAYWNVPIGGYHVHYQYATILAAKGHDVTIVFPRHLAVSHSVAGRLTTPLWSLKVRLQNRPLIGAFPLDKRVKVRLLRNLGARSLPNADVLVATAWQTAEVLADAPARCGRKFYVAYDYEHLMTAGDDVRRRIEDTYRQAFTIIATSGVVREAIQACGSEPAAEINCGLDFDEFGIDVPSEQRQRLTVGFPARAEPFKGLADAAEAAMILRARYGDQVRVAAFGAHKAGLPDWVEWHQRPSQAGLRRFYNAQSIFMLPSHFEGWGLTGVEALACGTALVTADNGGCRDYALDGATALVVPPKCPERLADAVDRLFRDEDLRARLAYAGHDHVQRYTWQEAGDRLESVLTSGGA